VKIAIRVTARVGSWFFDTYKLVRRQLGCSISRSSTLRNLPTYGLGKKSILWSTTQRLLVEYDFAVVATITIYTYLLKFGMVTHVGRDVF